MPSDPLSGAVAFGGRMFVLVTPTHERFPPANPGPVFRKSGDFKWSLCHTKGSFISHAVNQPCIRQNRKNSSEEVVSIKCYIISVVRPLNNLIYSLDFAVARFLMKLFKISHDNIISECRCDYSSFEFALPSKLLKKLFSMV